MGYLMRADFVYKVSESRIDAAENHVTLSGVQERTYREVDQGRPGLAKIECGLLRYCDPAIRRIAEEFAEDPQRVLCFHYRLVGKRGRRHAPKLLEPTEVCRRLRGYIALNCIFCLRVDNLLLLVEPVIETCDRQRNIRYPLTRRKSLLGPLFDKLADSDDYVPFGNFESKIK